MSTLEAVLWVALIVSCVTLIAYVFHITRDRP